MTIGPSDRTSTLPAATGARSPAEAPAANSRAALPATRVRASGRSAAAAAAAISTAAASLRIRVRVMRSCRAAARCHRDGSGYPSGAPAVLAPEGGEGDDRGDPAAHEERDPDLDRRPGEIGDGHRDVQVGPHELRAPQDENAARLDDVERHVR